MAKLPCPKSTSPAISPPLPIREGRNECALRHDYSARSLAKKNVTTSDEYCQDGFSNRTVNTLRTRRIHRDFWARGLEIRLEKSMLAGFVKYLPSARMDCTVPRFTVSCSQCAVSRDLLRFCWLSSDSVKCKGVSCVQGIECGAQNRLKWKKPCAAFDTQHRAKVDLEMSK